MCFHTENDWQNIVSCDGLFCKFFLLTLQIETYLCGVISVLQLLLRLQEVATRVEKEDNEIEASLQSISDNLQDVIEKQLKVRFVGGTRSF